jgi:hypothetical protein
VDPPEAEFVSKPGEGVFKGMGWRFDVSRDAAGLPCRTSVDLVDDDQPHEGVDGECIHLDRLEAFFVILRPAQGENAEPTEVLYAAGVLAPTVSKLEINFKRGGKRAGEVSDEAFLVLWEGGNDAAGLVAFDASGRELQRCNFEGDVDAC